MLRWGTAAAACLLLGGVRGAVVAASEETGQARKLTRTQVLDLGPRDFETLCTYALMMH